jgi:hypothetical protein
LIEVDRPLRAPQRDVLTAPPANRTSSAGRLDPIFLIVDQYNEFALPDEGWDPNTTDDIEPADDGIGYRAVDAVRQFIQQYRDSRNR